MPIHDIQSSFAAGEIAPDLQSRVDLAKYKTALKTCRNMIPGPHGSVSNRPGTYFIAETKDSTKASRLVPFVFNDEQAYVLEFGDQYIRFYKDGGQILDGGAYEVSTPYLEADLFELKFAQSADVIYIAHQGYAPRTLTRSGDADWTLALYPFKNGPFMFPNTDDARQMSYDGINNLLETDFDFFTADMVGAQFQITYEREATYLSGGKTATGVFSYTVEAPPGGFGSGDTIDELVCGGSWKLRTHGTWTGKISLQKSYDNGSTWETIQVFSSAADLNFDTFGTEDLDDEGGPFLIRVYMIAYTSGTAYVDLTADAFSIPFTVTATAFNDAQSMDATDVINTTGVIATNLSPLWSQGSWSEETGWPGTVTFFQDRMAWGGSPTEPQTVWFTKTNNYVDFGRSSPLVDSDGITINLLSRQMNAVKSLATYLQSCITFTRSSEWSIGAEGGALTPATTFAKLQGRRGIGSIDPIFIGNRIIFIDALSSSVRDLVIQDITDTFDSENISLLSDHLFKGYAIVDAAYAQEPDSLLWMVRDDGDLLCVTYLREQEVIAWSRHDTDGEFESVCTIPGDDGDEVWFIVNRDGDRFVERMLPRTESTEPADQYFVDCGISYSGAAASELSGYSHLNGRTVAINAGGFVLPQQAVSGGAVNIGTAQTKAHVGLPYTSDIETLNPEFPMRDGTLQGRLYRIGQTTFRFLNTVGGYVGSDFDTMDEIDMRDASLADETPTPLFTGFKKATVPPSEDPRGHICYRQTDPMPVTILAILPIINPGENP